jgi:uncharacterized damage-inducible protein DinB
MNNILGQLFLKDLEAEAPSTRKCLERIDEKLFDFKPHEKSMKMGNLAFVCADIPRWIVSMIKQSEIDFVTFKHDSPKNTADLVKFFDEHMKSARKALASISDEQMKEIFYLKAGGQTVASFPKEDNISSAIRHLCHHRGQLTVYMRLNNIPVPSIYGPTADEQGF